MSGGTSGSSWAARRDGRGVVVRMSHVNKAARSSGGAWVFGLEEIPAAEASEDGLMQQVAPVLGRTLIRAPEDTPQALRWAAEEERVGRTGYITQHETERRRKTHPRRSGAYRIKNPQVSATK